MKKQNLKKQLHEFPKIYRFITENLNSLIKNKNTRVGVFVFIYISLITLIVYLGFNFYNNYNILVMLRQEKEKTENKIMVWQGIIEKYPSFKDAYLQLGALEYKIRNFEKASTYVKKALVLDPEYSDAIELDKL